jgi:hypothetical protein
VVVVEIQEKVRVRIPRSYIDGKWAGIAAPAKETRERDGADPKAA